MNEHVITKDNVTQLALRDFYRTRMVIQAARIDGPFTVATKEGPLECPDGWCAVDVDGAPYPIAASVFEQTYSEDVMAFISAIPDGLLEAELARRERQVVGGAPIDLDA